MTNNASWILVALALAVGLAAGGWLAWRLALKRHAAQLRRTNDELQTRFAATIDQLRAAQVRAQTELEHTRATFKRQLASAAEEPLAALARAEERLRAAYDELDRLRRFGRPGEGVEDERPDGFAPTHLLPDGS